MSARLSKATIEAALRRVEASRGAVSVLRALSVGGVPEALAGQWIGAGRALLAGGAHPERARCAGGGCDEERDLGAMSKPRIGGKFAKPDETRSLARRGEGPECPACGSTAWQVPTELDVLRMRLALADTKVGADMLETIGKRVAKILDDDDPHLASSQVALIKHYQGALDERFAERSTLRLEGGLTVTPGASWAAGLKSEEVERLSPAAVEALRSIAELQRGLDEEARRVVAADLAGGVHVPCLPLLPGVTA